MQKSETQRFSIVIVADGDFPTHSLPLMELEKADIIIACDGATANLTKANFEPDYIVGDMDSLSPELQEIYKHKIIRFSEQESNDLSKAFRFALKLIDAPNDNSTYIPADNHCKIHCNAHRVHGAHANQESSDNHNNRNNRNNLNDCKLTTINILALSGKREDHTIGNISLLADYQKMATEYFAVQNTDINLSAVQTITKPIDKCQRIVQQIPVIKGITDNGIFEPYYSPANLPLKIENRKGCQLSIFAFDNSLNIISEGLEYQTDGVLFDAWWKATLNKIQADHATLSLNHSAPILLYYPY